MDEVCELKFQRLFECKDCHAQTSVMAGLFFYIPKSLGNSGVPQCEKRLYSRHEIL